MGWWKRKKPVAYAEKQRLIGGRDAGEMLFEDLVECCDGKSNPIKIFSADEIINAKRTRLSEFAEYEYGDWYSATLDNQRVILVFKDLKRRKPLKGAIPEVRDITISLMVSGHKNFIKLVGCCLETVFPIMVYYGEKKQYSHLDLKVIVSWRKRMKIAEEIAIALAYLHTAFARPFVYRNMYIRNILLDEQGVAKLSDFSNCVSIPKGETFVKVDRISGMYEYFDDDYMINGIVSERTDAFGFGILMQKLLTGEESHSRVHSWDLGERRIDSILDPNLLQIMGQVSYEERCQMEDFAVLSERCVGLRGELPKMVQVAKELKRLLKGSFSPFNETHTDNQT